MSEDRAGSPGSGEPGSAASGPDGPGSGPGPGGSRPGAPRHDAGFRPRLRAAPGRHRRLRQVTFAAVPVALALAGAVPVLAAHHGAGTRPAAAGAPSRILCGSWSRCDQRGYNSYGYGAHEYTAYWRMSPGDECTNYAAFVEATVYHVATPRYLLGDGGQWYAIARAHGVVVNHTPSVGAVADWTGYAPGMGPLGHVGVVEAVGPGDKYVVVSQQHMGGVHDYNWTLIKAHYPASEWQSWPEYFIHFPIPRRPGVGYYDPHAATFRLRGTQTAGPATRTGRLGLAGAVPLSGDWLGTGTDRLGWYNPTYGTFHLDGASRSRHPNVEVTLGPPHMVPLTGDWTGHGRDGLGYYDPKTGTFTLHQLLTGGTASARSFRYGPPGMIPLAGNWTGRGRKDDIGYYDPRTGTFTLRDGLATGRVWARFRFGPPHMIPLAGNWTGTGKDGIGYYDPRTGVFHLRDRLTPGQADAIFRFGPAHMIPLTGEWQAG